MKNTVLSLPARTAPDFSAIKARQKSTWAAGDYSVVGTTLQIVGEQLCESLDVRGGQKVLDVAAGNGNASLAAARRWCNVVATDYVPALLERARERAVAERLEMQFREADAEALPFADESFDVVMSTFGVMFTPDQEQAAGELVRVCKRGGKIGLANWTPAGFIGQLFATIGRYVPPAPGLKSPATWGTELKLAEYFGPHGVELGVLRRFFTFRYRSAVHWLDVFRAFYGPVQKAFAGLEHSRQVDLEHDLIALARRFNRSGDETLVLPSEYLEAVIVRR
jgi:ubiquinone/menaquinone biosynthesis C-methylase UbiE